MHIFIFFFLHNLFCYESRPLKSFIDYIQYSYEKYENQKLANFFHSYISSNLFELPDVRMRVALNELKFIAGSNKINDILYEVHKKLQTPIDYHYQRINNKRDHVMLGCSLVAAALSIASFAITYKIYKKWHRAGNIEYAKIQKDPKEMGVTITHDYANFGTKIVNYIGLRAKNPLSSEQWEFAGSCQNKLIKIANDKEWAINAEIFGGVLSIFSLPYSFACLYAFLYPCHKEHYEKLMHIKEIIENDFEAKNYVC